jgi:CRISPR/Cas system-associated protein endoribonuclease Cas2
MRAKFRKYDTSFEAKSVCRKIVLGAVNSTHSDMDCNEAKKKVGVLQVKDYTEKVFQKMKIAIEGHIA